ncbi:MAG: OsmC family protein [Deltaproteobacteria bacterium]|nr:OsmC family protein [Deltaproteobacteria bacterium]
MDMEITFPGGVAVDARYKGVTVHTDQPPPLGGGSGASPFDLFLASIGTCAGFYALRFCQERQIDTAGLKVRLAFERNPEKKLFTKITIHVELPADFPEKYRAAIVRTIDQCTVKRHIVEPPEFEVVTA